MKENEYLTVKEIAKLYGTSTRTIREKAKSLQGEKGVELLHKDRFGEWRIHHLIVGDFKPKNKKRRKYYAFSFTPLSYYSKGDIDKIMEFAINQMNVQPFEIHYVIEANKGKLYHHVHCIVSSIEKRKFLEAIRLGFSSISFKSNEIYCLDGWMSYITKQTKSITSLKK